MWHGTWSIRPNMRTLYFSFRVKPGDYYLTMNNDYPMPPGDRQIHLVKSQKFTTVITACVHY